MSCLVRKPGHRFGVIRAILSAAVVVKVESREPLEHTSQTTPSLRSSVEFNNRLISSRCDEMHIRLRHGA